MNHATSAAFHHNSLICNAFVVHHTTAQKMTKAEFIDDMWNRFSSTLLKSGCTQSDSVTLDQLRSHDFENTQGKRDFLAGKLFTMGPEGSLLQIDSPFQFLRDEERFVFTIGPMDNELSEHARGRSSRLH